MTTAYVALGSNLGDRLVNLGTAVSSIAELPETYVRAASHVYESEPAYHLQQPAFANGVVMIDTELSPEQLLGLLQQIEDDMGRVRAEENGPRVIDLDILLYGDEEIVSEKLVIPHPRLLERDFVVTPLLDVAPRVHLPDGTRVEREGATVGLVIGDLGPMPVPSALVDAPEPDSDWVVVAENSGEQDLVAAWDAGMHFKAESLAEAGIPFAWDPYEPESGMDPFGMPTTFKLLVAEKDVERATKLFADLDAAAPEFPEGASTGEALDGEAFAE